MVLPLIVFGALAALFLLRLGGGDPSKIPSALIGRPAPQTALPALEGLTRRRRAGSRPRSRARSRARSASSTSGRRGACPATTRRRCCTELGEDKRFQIVGINYKDAPDNARRFLGRYGNPFGVVGVDGNGRASIEWGVYGVPETFVVGRDGTIVYKLVGPITPAEFRSRAQGRDREGAEGGNLSQSASEDSCGT